MEKEFKEKNLQFIMNFRNITSQIVMLEQVAKVDSERTYEDMKKVSELIKITEEMFSETRLNQLAFNEVTSKDLGDLKVQVDDRIMKKVDEKCNAIFEKLKKEQNSIWKNC